MRKNILIVDDDRSFVSGIMNLLTDKNICLSIADSIKRAQVLLDSNEYDLVLANVKVPGGCSLILKKNVEKNAVATIFLFMSSLDSDYNYIKDMGESCFHKYDLTNSIGALIEKV